MNIKSLSRLLHTHSKTFLCFIFLSQVSSSLFLSGGKAFSRPQLALLNLKTYIVDFDQKGFSIPEVNVLLDYLSLRCHAFQVNMSCENDIPKFSLLLRFADRLNSHSLFEFVAQDFFYSLGITALGLIDRIPEMRLDTFEPLLFRVFLDLSSGLILEERVSIFSHLMSAIRPEFFSFEEFFSELDYKVLKANILKGSNITVWTLEIEGSLHTSFSIGNYDSEDWHLKFVDGNPHFELAKFLVTNAQNVKTLGYSQFAIFFSALVGKNPLPPAWKKAALQTAVDCHFDDAIRILKRNESLLPNPPEKRRKRTDDQAVGPPMKKPRMNRSPERPIANFSSVQCFQISVRESSKISIQKEDIHLLNHLRESLASLKNLEGSLEFSFREGSKTKAVNLPDLSWKSVKSFITVCRMGLSKNNGPPLVNSYKLASTLPTNEEERKELMSQVAEMVCVAIRFKFAEDKLLSLLDWYKVRMNGVWEELVQSGNEFVREVEETLNDTFLSEINSNRTEMIPYDSFSGSNSALDPGFQSLDNLHSEIKDGSVENSGNWCRSVQIFKIISADPTRVIVVQESSFQLLNHLQETLWLLKPQTGKLEFSDTQGTVSKAINLPDLSWEAVKSFVEVAKRGISNDNGPPDFIAYKLPKKITSDRIAQMELMSQVAQMVCVAIRLKFDEDKLLSLLEWYKVRMEGVWEELFESGNKFVYEVCAARPQMIPITDEASGPTSIYNGFEQSNLQVENRRHPRQTEGYSQYEMRFPKNCLR